MKIICVPVTVENSCDHVVRVYSCGNFGVQKHSEYSGPKTRPDMGLVGSSRQALERFSGFVAEALSVFLKRNAPLI